MPVASQHKHDKWAPVKDSRVINCVSSMTRVGKGVGFGAQRTGRFGEKTVSAPSDVRSKTGGSIGARTRSRPGTSQASVLSADNNSLVSCTRSVELFGLEHKAQPPSSLVGGAASVGGFGEERNNAAAPWTMTNTKTKDNWAASQGSPNKPRAMSSESLERRRTIKGDHRAHTSGGGQIGYPLGPMLSMSHSASSSIGSRPSTSSFCKGKRSTPSSWLGGSMGKDSPGPCYVPSESAFKLQNRRQGKSQEHDNIIMMERPTTGLVLGREERFCDGAGSFFSMTSPSVSPGSFAYRPESASDLVLPRRCTAHTFKPRRAFGDPNAHLLKQQVPGSKYDKVSGPALDTLSVYSASSAKSFGKAHREHPHSGDFVYMSAPPTCKQRIPYHPKHPSSTGSHAHSGLGTTQNQWA